MPVAWHCILNRDIFRYIKQKLILPGTSLRLLLLLCSSACGGKKKKKKNQTRDSANSHRLIISPQASQSSSQGAISPHPAHRYPESFPSAARQCRLGRMDSKCSNDTGAEHTLFHTLASVITQQRTRAFSPVFISV